MPCQPLIIISLSKSVALFKTPDIIPGCGFIEKHRVFDGRPEVLMKTPGLGLNQTFAAPGHPKHNQFY